MEWGDQDFASGDPNKSICLGNFLTLPKVPETSLGWQCHPHWEPQSLFFSFGDSLYSVTSQTHVGYGTHTCAIIPDPFVRSWFQSAEWIWPIGIGNVPPESSWHTGLEWLPLMLETGQVQGLRYIVVYAQALVICVLTKVNLWSILPGNDRGGISHPLPCVSPPLEPRVITHFLCSLHDT